MTREEIGTYLGLTLETVSRCFSKLQSDGVLQVQRRHVRVLDAVALERLVHCPGDAGTVDDPALASATAS